MRAALVLPLLQLFGCALFHTAPGDGSVDSGAGSDAGDSSVSAVDCGHLGPYLKCDETCDPCAGDRPYCSPYYGICVPDPVDEVRDFCRLVRDSGQVDIGDSLVYCEDESICALHPNATFGSSQPWLGGQCLDADYCRDVRAMGIEISCAYSDMSEFVDGPPSGDACPADEASPMAPLCGQGCGTDECPWPLGSGPDWAHTSCIGISDDRGVGVCVFQAQDPCAQAWPGVIEEFIESCITYLGAPCACLAKRNDDGTLWDRAWPIVEQSCRLYASLYPDDFACVGADWVPLE